MRNLLGKKFHKLLVVEKVKDGTIHKWLCICSCGNTIKLRTNRLTGGWYKSCGCWRKEVSTARIAKVNTQGIKGALKHGESSTRGYRLFHDGKRRAKKLERTPSWSNLNLIKEFYQNCPDGFVVDHIIPLQGKLVSGLHVSENLQYLTKSENSAKKNKFTPL